MQVVIIVPTLINEWSTGNKVALLDLSDPQGGKSPAGKVSNHVQVPYPPL